MPANVSPEYATAEKEYLQATRLEDKIEKLKKMISYAPSHKGGENLRAQLKSRLKRFKGELESEKKKKGSSGKKGIRKHEMQASIIGLTNSGKSTLLSLLTNQETEIADYRFTTKEPILGTLKYKGCDIHLIEIPAFESEFYDKGVVNISDTVIILVDDLEQIKEIIEDLDKAIGKKIIVLNKIDRLSENKKRKIHETLKSKYRKYDFALVSCFTQEGIEGLKEKIFKSFDKIRIYTKEPGKELDKEKDKPMILEPRSTVKDVAEKILKGFSKQVREARITGPSGKFPEQKVGLKHRVEDLDIVEFKTK